MFEGAFKNVDGIINKDAGGSLELAHAGQSSRALFLKHLKHLYKTDGTYVIVGN